MKYESNKDEQMSNLPSVTVEINVGIATDLPEGWYYLRSG
jgi:hypothetical protein